MMKRLALYFCFVFLIVFAATSFNRFFIDKKKTMAEALEDGGPLFQKIASTLSEESARNPATTANESSESPEESSANAVFKSWFQTEAQLVDATSVDTRSKEEEIKQMVKVMGPPEVEYLKKTSINPKTPQNQRILSTYLLSLGGDHAKKALVEIASASLNIEPAEPHTLQEVLNHQQRAQALMAVDAIAESSMEVADRMRQLQDIIQKTQDETVRNYAQRKRDELQL
jgi:hypothetical protein